MRTLELDFVFLQEVQNEQLYIPGYNVVCNVDHTRRGTAIALRDHIAFFQTLAYYLRHRTEHMILAGDFNCVLRQCDATGSNTSPALTNTVQQLQLRDVWVALRPNTSGHTYITHNSSSRLDRVYVSAGLCGHLRSADTHVCSFSDHQAVSVRICLPHLGRPPGSGFWSLRPHVLSADHIEEFQYRWQF